MAQKLKITYVRSVIRGIQKHRRTIRALGFRKLYQTVEHADTPMIRGMVAAVAHLVKVEPADH
ncbi:MAG: 50S ribosomal protein L30 [candidate division Zixibacteria bacterium]|nr:50S ribosomal protein L30 [candidate division Zixibacteria bacterium]